MASYRQHVCGKRLEGVGGLIRGQLQLVLLGLGLISKRWQRSYLHLHCTLLQSTNTISDYQTYF